jgi:hypothetical protein
MTPPRRRNPAKKCAHRSRPKQRRQPAEASGSVRPPIIDESAMFVVPANRTRHGPRMDWGKRQFVRGAIIAIGIPSSTAHDPHAVTKLWRQVKALLATNPDFVAAELGTIGRRTVANELKKLQRTS